VHWVVTEYGAADLWGKNVRQRAAALIEIAHPDFRAELVAQAKARKYVLPDQRLPRVPPRGEEPVAVEIEGGGAVTVRPIRLSDEEALRALFYQLSADSRYQRFHAHVPLPGHDELLRWVDTDHDDSVALVATANEGGEELIGMARYDFDRASGRADASVVVADAWQNRGVGTRLFRRLADVARARGVAGFRADVLADNGRMLAIFNKSGLQIATQLDHGTYHVNMAFPQ
jgi:GNAT superfamily N-acetyltransferase